MKALINTLVGGIALMSCAIAAADSQYREITWEDMIPEGAEQPKEYSIEDLHNLGEILAEEEEAEHVGRQTVAELAGQKIKLPAYVIPLEGDENASTEFLLVPYFGACIHVPPPPPNQVIYGDSKDGIESKLFDAVWAYGTMQIETINSEMAESGYSLKVDKVEILDFEEYDAKYRN